LGGEGEGEIHNVNGELRTRGGKVKGGNRGGGGDRSGRDDGGELDPYGFPIFYEDTTTIMNISPSILPNFHDLRNEDVFYFQVLCRCYDYLLDPQKLKLFPSTLKDGALKYFIGIRKILLEDGNKFKMFC